MSLVYNFMPFGHKYFINGSGVKYPISYLQLCFRGYIPGSNKESWRYEGMLNIFKEITWDLLFNAVLVFLLSIHP